MTRLIISWEGEDGTPRSRLFTYDAENTAVIELDLPRDTPISVYPIHDNPSYFEYFKEDHHITTANYSPDQLASKLGEMESLEEINLMAAVQRKVPQANKFIREYNEEIANRVLTELDEVTLISTVGNVIYAQKITLDQSMSFVIHRDSTLGHHFQYTRHAKLITEVNGRKYYLDVTVALTEVEQEQIRVLLSPIKLSYYPNTLLETHKFQQQDTIQTLFSHLLKGVKYWFIALRSPQYLITFLSVLIGVIMASVHTTVNLQLVWLVVIGTYAVQSGGNLLNDYFDDQSQVDEINLQYTISNSNKFIQNKLLNPVQAISVGIFLFSIGVVIGLYLNARSPGNLILGLGIFGAISTYFYTGEPIKLAYRGVGELILALNFGPLVTIGTYYVMTGTLVDWNELIYLIVPTLLFISGLLILNGLQDIEVDKLVGKTTTPVRLGRNNSLIAITAATTLGIALFIVGSFVRHSGTIPLINITILITGWLVSTREMIRLWQSPSKVPKLANYALVYFMYSLVLVIELA